MSPVGDHGSITISATHARRPRAEPERSLHDGIRRLAGRRGPPPTEVYGRGGSHRGRPPSTAAWSSTGTLARPPRRGCRPAHRPRRDGGATVVGWTAGRCRRGVASAVRGRRSARGPSTERGGRRPRCPSPPGCTRLYVGGGGHGHRGLRRPTPTGRPTRSPGRSWRAAPGRPLYLGPPTLLPAATDPSRGCSRPRSPGSRSWAGRASVRSLVDDLVACRSIDDPEPAPGCSSTSATAPVTAWSFEPADLEGAGDGATPAATGCAPTLRRPWPAWPPAPTPRGRPRRHRHRLPVLATQDAFYDT